MCCKNEYERDVAIGYTLFLRLVSDITLTRRNFQGFGTNDNLFAVLVHVAKHFNTDARGIVTLSSRLKFTLFLVIRRIKLIRLYPTDFDAVYSEIANEIAQI